MAYLEELLPEFRNGAKIRRKCWVCGIEGICKDENYSFHTHDVNADDWEIVPNKPIDWDYIIKNKCLCLFWDDENDENFIATLEAFEIDTCVTSFKSKNGAIWHNCRPVNRDEINFYEEKEESNDRN